LEEGLADYIKYARSQQPGSNKATGTSGPS